MFHRFLVAVAVAIGVCAAEPMAAFAADASVLIENGHYRRARTQLEADLKARPSDAKVHAQLAEVLGESGEHDAALRHAEKAVELAPKSADAHYRLAEIVGEMAQRAGPLKQMGLARRFKKEAEAALALDPNHIEARLGLMVFHLKAPRIAGGDKKRARALVEEVERIAPERGWQVRARYASETGDTTSLEGIYREAVTRYPDQYAARIAMASHWLAPWRAQREKAEEQARAAVALEPDRIGGYVTLAVVYAGAGRWEEVDDLLAQAQSRIPDNLSPHYQAGRVALVEANDGTRAEGYFRRYLSQPAEAGAVSHAAARWRLALALEKQGRRDEALAELRTAVKLDPKFEPAQKELKRLRS
jgi:tetratricopeptide (TPR) repeat protein